jgi:trimeric autotransporter adhesin
VSIVSWAKLEINGILSLSSSNGVGFGILTSEASGAPLLLKSRGGNSPDLVVATNGNVGIGTANPSGSLHIKSTYWPHLLVQAANNTSPTIALKNLAGQQWEIQTCDSGSTGCSPNNGFMVVNRNNPLSAPMTITTAGNVGIGTANPSAKLDVAGTVNASGGYTQSSDARLKDNIQPLDNVAGLSAIGKLRPVSFDWRDPAMGGAQQYGFIAQDVQKIFPNLVSKGARTTYAPDGTLTLNYDGLIAPLVKAVQEQQTEIESQNAEIESLMSDNAALKRDIEELRSAFGSGR